MRRALCLVLALLRVTVWALGTGAISKDVEYGAYLKRATRGGVVSSIGGLCR
ncbi:hypothetical protein BD310DRAFT_929371 [Dichomitus squalens]|uniref:Uncharacterized protein n=1 Tax=Dichomitus squalens TaxID=114155 RepID=A0A4Q9PSQ6_9APHY|nr:hypothetical protein BD310DRAFT_929371 [Dichomitus squalens]